MKQLVSGCQHTKNIIVVVAFAVVIFFFLCCISSCILPLFPNFIPFLRLFRHSLLARLMLLLCALIALSFRCPNTRITNKNKLFRIHLQLVLVWCLRQNGIIYELKCKLHTIEMFHISIFVFLACRFNSNVLKRRILLIV